MQNIQKQTIEEDPTKLVNDIKDSKQTEPADMQKTNQINQSIIESQKYQSICNIQELSSTLRQIYRKCTSNQLFNIGKLINSKNYWFFVCSLYFHPVIADFINIIQQKIKQLSKPVFRFGKPPSGLTIKQQYDFDDQLFILQNRLIIYRNNHNQNVNLSNIKQNSLENLIGLWEKQLQALQTTNHRQLLTLQTQNNYEKQKDQAFNTLLQNCKFTREMGDNQYNQLEERQIKIGRQIFQKKKLKQKYCQGCTKQQTVQNPVVQCSNCLVRVHKKCYPFDFENQFICKLCSEKIPKKKQVCVICSCTQGLMIKTDIQSNNPIVSQRFISNYNYEFQFNSKTKFKIIKKPVAQEQQVFQLWIHLICLKWIPQCYFDQQSNLVKGFQNIQDKKYKSICMICSCKCGFALQCVSHGCQKAFHPQCARRMGIYMTTTKVDRLIRQIYCNKHRTKHFFEILQQNRQKKKYELKKLFDSISKIFHQHSSHAHSSHGGRKPKKQLLQEKQAQKVKERSQHKQQRYCICNRLYNGEEEMIECERCFSWYHFDCVKIQNQQHFICQYC